MFKVGDLVKVYNGWFPPGVKYLGVVERVDLRKLGGIGIILRKRQKKKDEDQTRQLLDNGEMNWFETRYDIYYFDDDPNPYGIGYIDLWLTKLS